MKKQLFVLFLLLISAAELHATEAYRMGYQCRVTVVNDAGVALSNTQVLLKINSEIDTLTTDVDGKITLLVDASYRCPSNRSFFQRMFNRRQWSPKQFELYYNEQHFHFKRNWKRVFRNVDTAYFELNVSTRKIKQLK